MSDYTIFHNLARLHHYPYVLFVAHFYNWSDNGINTLRMLNTQGSLTAGQISEQLDIKPSSVTQIINKLEQVQAIEREKSPEDSRVTIVSITEEGLNILHDLEDVASSIGDELLEGFSSDDVRMLNDLLSRLISNASHDSMRNHVRSILEDDDHWKTMDSLVPNFKRSRSLVLAHTDPEIFNKNLSPDQVRMHIHKTHSHIFHS
ncbi:MarR family winged helix-turn-helix transcriptional regulator [Alloscardovia omnicolens]|uniref:MarR family winged helix-turn-helix transcriptional regulator n=1 Tax=Alloscardovia omnicolens TaxID=419015 RepID=UPI003A64BF1E